VSFALDPRLNADTLSVGDLSLCRVLLMNDARYPWVILVPRRAGLTDVTELSPDERGRLIDEIAQVADTLRGLPEVEKINFGSLGNIVRQLHAHVIGRRAGDFAWPGPAWGAGAAVPYEAAEGAARRLWLADKLGLTASGC
jgi:diadenosine tetraphosphate (Ap4A) HIT family hydrolase